MNSNSPGIRSGNWFLFQSLELQSEQVSEFGSPWSFWENLDHFFTRCTSCFITEELRRGKVRSLKTIYIARLLSVFLRQSPSFPIALNNFRASFVASLRFGRLFFNLGTACECEEISLIIHTFIATNVLKFRASNVRTLLIRCNKVE